jgi:hypothetical protein
LEGSSEVPIETGWLAKGEQQDFQRIKMEGSKNQN